MQFTILAVVKQDNKVLGFRVLKLPNTEEGFECSKNFEVMHIALEVLLRDAYNTSDNPELKKAKLEYCKFISEDKSLDRYAQIDTDGNLILSKSPLVIIRQVIQEETSKLLGYLVSDYTGNVGFGYTKDIISFVKKNGIANGTLVTKAKGEEYIKAIGEGQFIKYFISNKPMQGYEACPDHSWNTQEFTEYMDKNGLKYDIRDRLFYGVDNRVTKLRVPSDILSINNLSTSKSLLNTLIIEESVLNDKNISKLSNLKKIIFVGEKCSMYLSTTATSYDQAIKIPLDLDIEFSDEIKDINGYFCNWDIEGITPDEMFSRYLKVMKLPNIRSIDNCFNNCNFGDKEIKIPKQLNRIEYSFINSIIGKINLDDAVHLKTIFFSFMLKDFKQESLNISSRYEYINIDATSFAGVKVNQVNCISDRGYMECLSELLDNGGKVIIDGDDINNKDFAHRILGNTSFKKGVIVELKNKKTLYEKELYDLYCDKVILNEGIEFLENACAMSSSFDIEFPTTLKYISDSAFEGFNKKIDIDLSKCKNLNSISDLAFAGASISGIILPDNLEYIGNSCFKNTELLKYIYIPSSIKHFGRMCLQNCGSAIGGGTAAFVYKGSLGEKYCKQNKLRIVYVESLEDAMEQIDKLNPKLPDKKISKIKMILSASDDSSELLQDKYINRALEFSSILDASEEENSVEHALSRDGLISIPLENAIKPEDLTFINEGLSESYTDDSMIEVINLIKMYSLSFNSLIVNNKFEYFMKKALGENIRFDCLVKSQKYKIIVSDILLMNTKIEVLLILDDKNIIYCTMINKDKSTISIQSLIGDHTNTKREIHTLLNKDLFYPLSSTYMSFDMPSKLKTVISFTLNKQLILIGNEQFKPNNKDGVVKVLMYSLANGDILECLAKINKSIIQDKTLDGYVILKGNNIQSIKIENIYTRDKVPKEIIDMINRSIFNSYATREVVKNNFDEFRLPEKNKLAKLDNAYDLPKACLEWELSKLIKENNIKHPNQLTAYALYQILATDIFLKTKVDDSLYNGSPVEVIQSRDGNAIINSFSLNKETKQSSRLYFKGVSRYVIQFIGKIKDREVSVVVLSNRTFSDMFDEISSIYNSECKPEEFIDNNKVSLSDFYIVREGKKKVAYGKIFTLVDAINRSNGCVFTLLYEKSSEAYKILRFKSLKDAILADTVLERTSYKGELKETKKYPRKQRYGELFNEIKVIKDGKLPESNVMIARDFIMKGYPNGYSIGGEIQSIFDLAAKQSHQS